MCQLPPIEDPAVLVGSSTSDDAAAYRIDNQRAIIPTVDFITPIVDDPYDYGRIAAANSISDVMATLNRDVAEALGGLKVHALTDITGFGPVAAAGRTHRVVVRTLEGIAVDRVTDSAFGELTLCGERISSLSSHWLSVDQQHIRDV